jgi:hypothetical protein
VEAAFLDITEAPASLDISEAAFLHISETAFIHNANAASGIANADCLFNANAVLPSQARFPYFVNAFVAPASNAASGFRLPAEERRG